MEELSAEEVKPGMPVMVIGKDGRTLFPAFVESVKKIFGKPHFRLRNGYGWLNTEKVKLFRDK